ncbi:AAA family ATPase [candidate division WOR-3 bacterium]|nr:AAA family ATPase [candidate division WOR-3 bacterium]
MKIDINEQFKKALDVMEHTDKHIFVTGKAGTGKSTLLSYFRSVTKKKIVVLAPTGVAALNVQGETIHSFFGFKPDVTLQNLPAPPRKRTKLIKELDAIVIDEISMVRADLLDCMDHMLRHCRNKKTRPFGGVQMILIGDLYQLPPVVTSKEKKIFKDHYASEYFFDSRVFKRLTMEFIELEKVYRQKDESFIDLLNVIRNNTVTDDHLTLLNTRVGAEFSPKTASAYVVYLTPYNKTAYQINTKHLEGLKGRMYTWHAGITGAFDEHSYPTDFELNLKTGAQVMMLNNDKQGRWVNGTLGTVTNIRFNRKKGCEELSVRLAGGDAEKVLPFTWEIFHFQYNEESRTIETETVGSFTQYPLKLAWAVTIHKSQGKTFDRVIIDVGRGTFAGGQMYVALSRCTAFQGIVLKKPVKKGNIFTDWRIVKFLTRYQYTLSDKKIPLDEKITRIQEAIDNSSALEIVYLKPNDEKSTRMITPSYVGEHVYKDRPFIGVTAYCHKRKEERVFRVDRILHMRVINRPAEF